MYVKLTRLDNSPIWINAAFVVTIEPRKGGGSVVVPIGDGLDYDVRETPEKVLAMLAGAPSPTVVPVPPPKGLAPTSKDDLSPEFDPTPDLPPPPPEPSATAVEPATAAEPAPAVEDASAAEPAPAEAAKGVRRTRRTKKSVEDGAEPKAPRKSRARAKKTAVELSDDLVERLRKMMPGSTRKLLNTLVSQFKIDDAEPVVAALQERGIIEVDREHVIWK